MNQTQIPQPRIAIVGSGPAGCYTAGFLRKRWPEAPIVLFDRLTTPYGLVRYGVAPDHLGTKGIAKQFDRLFARDRVEFRGGVEIGRDLGLDQLRAEYDIVVLATGLWADRSIDGFRDVEGNATHAGVHGSGELTRMINGHPDRDSENLVIGRNTVIVGNGNVAVDLVRLMLTDPGVLTGLDVPIDAINALHEGPVARIDVVGRSAADEAKFDPAMIRELGKLPDVRFTSDAVAVPGNGDRDATAKMAAIVELVEQSPVAATRSVNFHFGWTPDTLQGSERVASVIFRDTGGQRGQLVLETDSVCTAVGFTEVGDDVLLRSALEGEATNLERGMLAEGLYCVGWLRRGPVGTIPVNRADAKMVANAIINDVESSVATVAR
ncbi:FAD-dependent oxidoreductase [Paeniglutamicibacter psychrophenolicus]|uniref:FAD-dependent oxidoreductase n=1 Tax=Paeniglutamicibacter psychrophenolicus TaxID=257454 RepID=UPI0027806A27|nr:FAD-dependent oxidoreductase [Paeniglutamicibacter psychrophenolicus]MDQ0092228.1 ferredoxin--NADP+ reductase [Paeniglutamicibacter psychrophenolicus]